MNYDACTKAHSKEILRTTRPREKAQDESKSWQTLGVSSLLCMKSNTFSCPFFLSVFFFLTSLFFLPFVVQVLQDRMMQS